MADALDQAMSAYGATPAGDPMDLGMSMFLANAPKPVSPTAPPAKAPPARDPGMLNVARNGLFKGMAGLGDMIGSGLVNVANLGIAGYGAAKGALGGTDLPELIPSDALSGYSKLGHAAGLIDDANEPTTAPQRVVDFASQVVGGGGLNPRAVVRAGAAGSWLPVARDVLTPIAAGTAGGVTREFTNDLNPDSVWGRLGSAALPSVAMMGGSYPLARMSTAGERASQTTRNVTPAQWDAASALAGKADALGAPLSATEAIQGVTGANPGLTSLQRVTEQSTAGVKSLAPAFARRPAQNAALVDSVLSDIAPRAPSPDTLAGTLQTAAQSSIDAARAQGNAAAAPFYARSSNDPSVKIQPHDWNAIVSDPAVAWALDQTQRNPLLGVQGATPGSVQWLDAAKKFLDSKSASLMQSGDRFPGSQASSAAARITGAVDPVLPDYARARAMVAANMRNNVVPLENGQVGKLAGTNDFVSQAANLLPERPMDVTPAVINTTAATIGRQDPDILRQFIAQHLRGTFNEANQDLQSGANQFGGARFAAKVAGNDMQAQNLNAALTSSGADPTGLTDALSIFRAQGTRPQQGSATTFNNGEVGLLSGGLLSTIGKPLAAPGLLAEKLGDHLSTNRLAEALHPDANTVQRLKELARANGTYSPMEQAALAALLRAASSATPPAAPGP